MGNTIKLHAWHPLQLGTGKRLLAPGTSYHRAFGCHVPLTWEVRRSEAPRGLPAPSHCNRLMETGASGHT